MHTGIPVSETAAEVWGRLGAAASKVLVLMVVRTYGLEPDREVTRSTSCNSSSSGGALRGNSQPRPASVRPTKVKELGVARQATGVTSLAFTCPGEQSQLVLCMTSRTGSRP